MQPFKKKFGANAARIRIRRAPNNKISTEKKIRTADNTSRNVSFACRKFLPTPRQVNCSLRIQINSKASINNRQNTDSVSSFVRILAFGRQITTALTAANIEFDQILTLFSTTQPLKINKTVSWPKYHNRLIKTFRPVLRLRPTTTKLKSTARSGTAGKITHTRRRTDSSFR